MNGRNLRLRYDRSELYYKPSILKEIDSDLTNLTGVSCSVDITADSGSTITEHVRQAKGQGIRLRRRIPSDVKGKINPFTAPKLLVMSHDQWVSSTGQLQLLSCARRNDNAKKAADVEKAVSRNTLHPFAPSPTAHSGSIVAD